MRFSEYELLFSQARMARFLTAAGGDVRMAKRYYRANLAISEAFLPVLSAFEVALRNRLHIELSRHFGKANWILLEKDGFMRDFALGPDYRMRGDVTRAVDRLLRERRPPNRNNVLAEQTLGFWVSMFDPKPYRLLKGVPIQVFAHRPRRYGRLELANDLHRVRLFRNRVFHNEPICFDKVGFSLSEPHAIMHTLFDLAAWMDASLLEWLTTHTRTQTVLARQASACGA